MEVSTALTTATTLFTWVIDTITANAILTAVFVVTTLIPAGIMVFKKIKRSV